MELAAVFKALGHPLRWRILDTLMAGMHCNCELAAQFDCPLSLISYHLRILQEAGLVAAERDADDAAGSIITGGSGRARPAFGRGTAHTRSLAHRTARAPVWPQAKRALLIAQIVFSILIQDMFN
jgi:DNA-binding transcriptional ArsR family regulator